MLISKSLISLWLKNSKKNKSQNTKKIEKNDEDGLFERPAKG